VIDFIQQRIENALEITLREEKNKSLQQMLSELNDNTINSFEFGKNFLAYLLSYSKVVGADLVTSKKFNGSSIECGKLHRLLIKGTDPVMKLYVEDLRKTEQRLQINPTEMIADSPGSPYIIGSVTYENTTLSGTTYIVNITDNRNCSWNIRQKYLDFENLYKSISDDYLSKDLIFNFPTKISSLFPTPDEQSDMCEQLRQFLIDILDGTVDCNSESRKLIGLFIQVKTLIIGTKLHIEKPENIPNYFLDLKEDFQELLLNTTSTENIPKMSTRSTSGYVTRKDMNEFRSAWGHDGVFKILESYAQLQRMASILGWTLEINHFFVSMFGNTLAFSKLPIREVLLTQKNIMLKFQSNINDLFEYACQINKDNKYTWHKNLEVYYV
jgi:hypothetical protein